jgi:hypothetical protein
VKYLLGVMNSAAARDFLRANRRSNIHLYPDDWKKLPIPDVSPDQQKPIVKLVDRILVAKRADPNADLTPLEAEIDTKVAALYGVSSDSSSSPSSSSSSSSRSSSISTSSPASPAATIHRYRRTEQAMKELLRDQLLPKLAAETPYFSLETIRQALEGARCPLDPPTLNRYLHELTEGQHIFDAGRGWYSSLAKPFVLDTTSVKPLVDALAKAFPLVAFSCWSTEQVKGAMHHLLNRFVAFVNVEPDAMENVWEYLRDAGWDSWLNPRGTEATRFAVRERTVVVRRESRKSPSKEPLAPIEKLLVELYFEARDLQLMALSEFYTMLGNLAGRRRIQMATLLSYAAERKLPLKEFFGDRNQLIPPF